MQLPGQAGAAGELERDQPAVRDRVLRRDQVIVARDDGRGEWGQHRSGQEADGLRVIQGPFDIGLRLVGQHDPACGRGDPEGEDRLEVGLVEAGVGGAGVGLGEFGVDVRAAVGGIRPVHAGA